MKLLDCYITSDLHLNHKNRNSEEFTRIMINKINSSLNLIDIIFFLGDMGKKDDLTSNYSIVKDFLDKINPCVKILILGNHDNLKIEEYYRMGFSFVTNKINFFDQFILSHYPLNLKPWQINFHGHIHEENIYFNVDWKNHINCYCKNFDCNILKIGTYLMYYKAGKLKKGKTVRKEF